MKARSSWQERWVFEWWHRKSWRDAAALVIVLAVATIPFWQNSAAFARELQQETLPLSEDVLPVPTPASQGGLQFTGTTAAHLGFASRTASRQEMELQGTSADAFERVFDQVTWHDSLVKGVTLLEAISDHTDVVFWYQNRLGGYNHESFKDADFEPLEAEKLAQAVWLVAYVMNEHSDDLLQCGLEDAVKDLPEAYTSNFNFVGSPMLDVGMLGRDLRYFFHSPNRNFHVAIGSYTGHQFGGVTYSEPLDSYPTKISSLANLATINNLSGALIAINLRKDVVAERPLHTVAGIIFHEILHNFGFQHTKDGVPSNDASVYIDNSIAIRALQTCMVILAEKTEFEQRDKLEQEEQRRQQQLEEERKQREAENARQRQQVIEAARRGEIPFILNQWFADYPDDTAWMTGEFIADVCWYGTLHGYAEDVWFLCEEAVNLWSFEGFATGAVPPWRARDVRGLNRAVRGDLDGALEDFEAFLDEAPLAAVSDEQYQRRAAWIEALTAGRAPIDAAELQEVWSSEVEGRPAESAPVATSTLAEHIRDSMQTAAVTTSYSEQARQFVDTLLANLGDFSANDAGVSEDAMTDALWRPDVGLRINAIVDRIWKDWLPFNDVNGDPGRHATNTPFRVLVIRLIQGRQLQLTDSEIHALHNLFTRTESLDTWRESDGVRGIIASINQNSFQSSLQTGNSTVVGSSTVNNTQPTVTTANTNDVAPAQPQQAQPQAVQPQTPDPVAPSTPANRPIDQAITVTNFESFGTWSRGDETWGTFTQSTEQSASGQNAGKISYDFPTVDNNYVIFQRTMDLGRPDALRAQVYGDGSTHLLNVWVQDANQQLWQFTFGRINHTGWQTMWAPLDLSLGWPNQAVGDATTAEPTYPLRFYAFVLDGYTSDRTFSGTVYLDDLTAVTFADSPNAAYINEDSAVLANANTSTQAPAATTNAADTTATTATVTAQTLNVRSGPGANFQIIGKVQQGQVLPVLERDAATGWARVETPSGIGWVSGDYVQLTEE